MRRSDGKQKARLLQLLRMLCGDDEVKVADAAAHFRVDKRTIYRDLALLKRYFPMIDGKEGKRLDTTALQAHDEGISEAMLRAFAHNAALEVPYLDAQSDHVAIRFAVDYRSLPKHTGERALQAIVRQRKCRFDYRDKDGKGSKRTADAILLFTQDGLWYLVAVDNKDGEIKHFRLDRMQRFELTDAISEIDESIRQKAYQRRNSWQTGEACFEVLLYVLPQAARYFKESKLLHPSQEIVDEHYDGSAVVRCRISHEMELLPHIQRWIPYVAVLEPPSLAKRIREHIESYTAFLSQLE